MKDWGLAQTHASQEMAELHYFSIKKGEVEFIVTVKEYVTPKEPTMHFLAQTYKFTNQKNAPYRPCGWGKTMLEALSECVKALNKFPYEARPRLRHYPSRCRTTTRRCGAARCSKR